MKASVLKTIRDTVGLSQTQFAKKLKIPQTSLSSWETGNSPVPMELFEKLVNAFGVNPEYLFDQSQPMFTWEFKTGIPVPEELRHLQKARPSESDNEIICIPVINYKSQGIDSLAVNKLIISPYDMEKVKAFRVEDTDMLPVFSPGDYAIFVENLQQGNGFYFIEFSHTVGIRRLFFKMDGTIEAHSEARGMPVEPLKNFDGFSGTVSKIIAWIHRER